MKQPRHKSVYLFFSIIIFTGILHAQTTIILQPNAEDGKDARVQSILPNTNMGNSVFFHGHAGTMDLEPFIDRSLIEFDLSAIPENATILNATLSLYANTLFGGHATISGTNACWLERVVSPWVEDEVTWANQPATSVDTRVSIPFSTNSDQDYTDISVTELVKDMVYIPNNSYGFMIKLQVESEYRYLEFCSSDEADENLHPKLTITYYPGPLFAGCTYIKPNADEGKDARVQSILPNTNIGNSIFFHGHAGTMQGQPFIDRSFIEFDLSKIPANFHINKATLSLYSNTEFGGHATISGTNAGWLQRITSPWEEDEITWNNQPETTSENQVAVPLSKTFDQDYENIVVTELVKDMMSDPENSFGFMLTLQVESDYRYLEFCSSDSPDPGLHPELFISFTLIPGAEAEEQILNPMDIADAYVPPSIQVYPNPTDGLFFIDADMNSIDVLELVNIKGQTIFRKTRADFTANQSYDISNCQSGIYLLKLYNTSDIITRKVIRSR